MFQSLKLLLLVCLLSTIPELTEAQSFRMVNSGVVVYPHSRDGDDDYATKGYLFSAGFGSVIKNTLALAVEPRLVIVPDGYRLNNREANPCPPYVVPCMVGYKSEPDVYYHEAGLDVTLRFSDYGGLRRTPFMPVFKFFCGIGVPNGASFGMGFGADLEISDNLAFFAEINWRVSPFGSATMPITVPLIVGVRF